MKVDEHFVAFIDILGFAEKVKSDFSKAEINESSNFDLIRQAIVAARALGDVNSQISVQQFSDSIIVSMIYAPDGFPTFALACAKLQADLLAMKILVRGGLTYGKHYSADGFLYSQALIDAYKLESQEAINPRILCSEDIVYLIFKSEEDALNSGIINLDSDRNFYLNYAIYMDKESIPGAIEWATLEHSKSRGRVADKMCWLMNYLSAHL
jgi:hypothetical protein